MLRPARRPAAEPEIIVGSQAQELVPDCPR
jgi:hypothetical protein